MVKNMKQVIEMSSNTGIARIIFRGYSANPEKYYDRLASIGFFDRIGSGIAGEQKPKVRRLTATDGKGNNITITSRHLDLARQAYGYNTMIPPLHSGLLQRHSKPRPARASASRQRPPLRKG